MPKAVQCKAGRKRGPMSAELVALWRHLTVQQRRAILGLARCFAGSKGASGHVAVTFRPTTKDDNA